jgi:hypothetical protein
MSISRFVPERILPELVKALMYTHQRGRRKPLLSCSRSQSVCFLSHSFSLPLLVSLLRYYLPSPVYPWTLRERTSNITRALSVSAFSAKGPEFLVIKYTKQCNVMLLSTHNINLALYSLLIWLLWHCVYYKNNASCLQFLWVKLWDQNKCSRNVLRMILLTIGDHRLPFLNTNLHFI